MPGRGFKDTGGVKSVLSPLLEGIRGPPCCYSASPAQFEGKEGPQVQPIEALTSVWSPQHHSSCCY